MAWKDRVYLPSFLQCILFTVNMKGKIKYTYIFEIAPMVKYPREFSKRFITEDDSAALWARA